MMATIQESITGQEITAYYWRAAGCPLREFYRALNNRDIALMEINWDASDYSAMDNPFRRGSSEGGTKFASSTNVCSLVRRITPLSSTTTHYCVSARCSLPSARSKA